VTLIENLASKAGYHTLLTNTQEKDIDALRIYRDKDLSELYCTIYIYHENVIDVRYA
jgi:hypothetical protein